jgi:hypothetical protein
MTQKCQDVDDLNARKCQVIDVLTLGKYILSKHNKKASQFQTHRPFAIFSRMDALFS